MIEIEPSNRDIDTVMGRKASAIRCQSSRYFACIDGAAHIAHAVGDDAGEALARLREVVKLRWLPILRALQTAGKAGR